MNISNLCFFDKTQEESPSLKLLGRFAMCRDICGGGLTASGILQSI